MIPFQTAMIRKLREGKDLSFDEAREMIAAIVEEAWSRPQTVDCLLALREKGETVEEIAGAATALRQRMSRISSVHERLIDTCGTGGDRSRTFNVSTAAALVTAAAGLPVAKHGNRGVSSKSGSADVLTELGVDVLAPRDRVERCLDALGICFCFAPLCHASVRNVASIRAELGVPTIFNWLGPLVNPAGTGYQLLGVGRSEMRPVVAQVLARLGTVRSAVVHGQDGLDEVTISAPTDVSLVTPEGIREWEWTPEEFGLARSARDGLTVGSPRESADVIRSVLAGEKGAARDLVVINAAAALWVAQIEDSLPECRQTAESAIDSGRAAALLARLVELSHGDDN